MPTVAGAKRALSRGWIGKAAALAALLVVALVVAQSCGSRETEVSREEAVEIAKGEIDYEPEKVMTRFVPRGIKARPNWAVSLSTLDADGNIERVTVVVVDGRTGDVVEIRTGTG